MEVESLNSLKHWVVIRRKGHYAEISCPELRTGVKSFSEKRSIYKELFVFEDFLRPNYKGWVGWTGVDNSKMIRFLRKVGAQPYYIDIEYDSIWFVKTFAGEKK